MDVLQVHVGDADPFRDHAGAAFALMVNTRVRSKD
jgi:hypothetical protein